MNAMVKVGLGAVAGAVVAKFAKGHVTPHTGFLGTYNETIVEAALTAVVAIAVSKVL